MLELTEGEAHVAVKSAQNGDRFLVRGRQAEFVENPHKNAWVGLRFPDDEWLRWDCIFMFTRRELQGLLMTNLFEIS